MVAYMTSEYNLSIQQACRNVRIQRSSYYYQPRGRDDKELIAQLNRLADEHPSYGFRKMYHSLRNAGYPWNKKRVHRVYKALGLNLQRKRKRRLPVRARNPLEQPNSSNEVWSIDFMSDALFNGRRFRTLNIIDDYNREALWIEVGLSIGAQHMIDLLNWIIKERGKPKAIRTDNGPEFTSIGFTQWCHKHRIEIWYIQPGKPVQNAFIERFNRSFRTEVLDMRSFESIVQVRELSLEWVEHYNTHRPHESLGNVSPLQYLLQAERDPFPLEVNQTVNE